MRVKPMEWVLIYDIGMFEGRAETRKALMLLIVPVV